MQTVLTSLPSAAGKDGANQNLDHLSSTCSLGSILPDGVAGGSVASAVIALLVSGKFTRKITEKVNQFGGAAVLGGLAHKAHENWKTNKAIGQVQAITDQDIQRANSAITLHLQDNDLPLEKVLTAAMVTASNATAQVGSRDHKRLFDAIGKLNINAEDKAAVINAMACDVTVHAIASAVSLDEHKAEVYLSAYLAIKVDDQLERTFLNELAIALNLPRGFSAYLEQQADQGIAF
jgi:uncharacterized membrane protein YebE (DUF533 family)